MSIQPSETILATFPIELVEMMDKFNHRDYSIHQNGSRGKNEEFQFDLVHANQSILLEVYNREFKKIVDYEKELNKRYNENEQISLYNMMAYFRNKQNGFGRRNDEKLFENEKKNTKLFEEILKWIEISKDCNFLQNTVIKYKVLSNMRRKTKHGK